MKPTEPNATDSPLQQAEALLQEAVYRSRAAQAGQTLMAPIAKGQSAKGQCGLGQEAAVVLDLSPRGADLFSALGGEQASPEQLARIRATMTEWVERQDQFDRDRNHFMKAFRGKHGFRRSDYDGPTLAEYEAGLEAVNQKVARARSEQARDLLTILG